MIAETTLEFEALEAQAANLLGRFIQAGYQSVAPSLIQPAGLFLDRIGETIRARTYVFTDPSGEELCLRPDLTLPVTRIFLERGPQTGPAKYCYNGPAFRIQDGQPDPLRPREFRQAGIEYFGVSSAAADAEVFALSLEALRAVGLNSFVVKLGHIGLFNALLAALPIPPRWRQRLERAFWRPQAFAHVLKSLANGEHASFLAYDAPFPAPPLTETKLYAYLQANEITFIGSRSTAEVLQRLIDKAADANEPPLPIAYVDLIETYLRLQGPVPQTFAAMRAVLHKAGVNLDTALTEAETLFERFAELAAPAPLYFAADFGRHFEYYTGMMFQVEIEGAGVAGQIAGGGRYDGLIRALTAGAREASAVGAAIHTERLLAAISRG